MGKQPNRSRSYRTAAKPVRGLPGSDVKLIPFDGLICRFLRGGNRAAYSIVEKA